MTINFKWLGCAAYVLDLNGTKLMFDPFFYRQKNPKTNPRLETQREDIKDVNSIFITHGHIDHITDAGWFAEHLGSQVYCSQTSKENIISWAKGEIFEEEAHELSPEARENIHVVEWGDIIDINENISVEVLKSKHIRFDLNTIFARVKNKEFWKDLKNIRPFTKLGKGPVLAFCVKYKNKTFITYGSLWHKYIDVLNSHRGCDVFIAPLAGNSKQHIAKKAGKMIEILRPKIVIPLHWDDFYPPVSRKEDLRPFMKFMKINYPETEVLMPKIDENIEIIK